MQPCPYSHIVFDLGNAIRPLEDKSKQHPCATLPFRASRRLPSHGHPSSPYPGKHTKSSDLHASSTTNYHISTYCNLAHIDANHLLPHSQSWTCGLLGDFTPRGPPITAVVQKPPPGIAPSCPLDLPFYLRAPPSIVRNSWADLQDQHPKGTRYLQATPTRAPRTLLQLDSCHAWSHLSQILSFFRPAPHTCNGPCHYVLTRCGGMVPSINVRHIFLRNLGNVRCTIIQSYTPKS